MIVYTDDILLLVKSTQLLEVEVPRQSISTGQRCDLRILWQSNSDKGKPFESCFSFFIQVFGYQKFQSCNSFTQDISQTRCTQLPIISLLPAPYHMRYTCKILRNKCSMYMYLYYTYPALTNQMAEFHQYNRSEFPTAKRTNQSTDIIVM